MKSFCVIMVQFSGVIRIELSAAINALHHSSPLRAPHGGLSPNKSKKKK